MKDKLTMFLYDILRFLLNKLPAKTGCYLGRAIGSLAYLITPSRREHSRLNLKKALNISDKESKKLIKAVYKNLGYNFTEFLIEDSLTKEDIEKMVDFEGLEYLDQALAEGGGVILYTAHFGNWELLGAVLALKGYKIHSIAQEQNNSLFNQKINRIRSDIGIGIIPKGFSIRKAYKVLKSNQILAILGDQHARKDGWILNFFNRPALTFPGAVKLAQRTNAVIVPTFFKRQGWLQHKLKFYQPRKIEKDAADTELKKELQSLLYLTEKEIKAKPADWLWLHKRWKTYS